MTQAGLVFTMLPKLTPQLLQSSCLSLLPSSPEVSSNFCSVSKTWILICQGVFMTNLPFSATVFGELDDEGNEFGETE